MSNGKGLISNLLGRDRLPPGPKGDLILGVLRQFQENPLVFLRETAKSFPGIAHLRFAHMNVILLDDVNHIQHVAKNRPENYKKSQLYDVARDIVGNGLFTSEGEKWRSHHEVLAPALSHSNLAELLPFIAEDCDYFFSSALTSEAEVDVAKLMKDVVLDFSVPMVFGRRFPVDSHLPDAWNTMNSEILERWQNIFSKVTALIPTKKNMAFRNAKLAIEEFAKNSIEEQKNKKETASLVSFFLNAPKVLSADDLQEELLTFLMSGHEGTAMALAWTLFQIGSHPHVKKKVFQEIDANTAANLASFETQNNFPYLTNVIKETLRLFPPLWGISRVAQEDDEIGSYNIPAGAMVLVSPYITHRNPKYWQEPDRFDPERFASPQSVTPLSYFPFGFGHRACVGASLASAELLICLTTLLRKFDFEISNPQRVTPVGLITISPGDSLRAKFFART